MHKTSEYFDVMDCYNCKTALTSHSFNDVLKQVINDAVRQDFSNFYTTKMEINELHHFPLNKPECIIITEKLSQ